MELKKSSGKRYRPGIDELEILVPGLTRYFACRERSIERVEIVRETHALLVRKWKHWTLRAVRLWFNNNKVPLFRLGRSKQDGSVRGNGELVEKFAEVATEPIAIICEAIEFPTQPEPIETLTIAELMVESDLLWKTRYTEDWDLPRFSVSFLSDEVAGYAKDDIVVYRWAGNKEKLVYRCEHKLSSIRFADLNRLYYISDSNLYLQNLKNHSLNFCCELPYFKGILSMEENIIYCNSDNRLVLFSDECGFRLSVLGLKIPTSKPGVVSISRFSKTEFICAVSESSDGVLFDVSGQASRTFVGHGAEINIVGKCSERTLCTSSKDHTLKLWDVRIFGAICSLVGSNANCQAMHTTQEYIFGAYDDRTVRTWDVRGSRPKPIVGISLNEIDPVTVHYIKDWDKLHLTGVKSADSDDPLMIPLNSYQVYYSFLGQG
jgi:hypothetical protein